MNLQTLAQGEPWMTPDERTLNQDLIQSIANQLTTNNIPESPLLMLRVNDIAVTWLLARRLESALTPTDAEPAPCPTPAQAAAIGKCRERLRKAMKEFETCCKTSAPIQQGLAEQMYDTIMKIQLGGYPKDNASTPNPTPTSKAPSTPDQASAPKSVPRDPATPVRVPGAPITRNPTRPPHTSGSNPLQDPHPNQPARAPTTK